MVMLTNPKENVDKDKKITITELQQTPNKRQPIFYSMNSDTCKNALNYSGDKIILLDIDDTLYKASSKLLMVRRNRTKEAFEKFKAEGDSFYTWKDEVTKGSSQTIYERLNVSPIVFEKEKNIQYDQFIERDDRLIDYLSKTNCRCWCFTNAIRYKAEKVINSLGISEFIEGVICCDDHIQRPILKPIEESYKFVESLLQIDKSNRKSIYFFDDNAQNVQFAYSMGWNVGLVGKFDHIVDVLKRHV